MKNIVHLTSVHPPYDVRIFQKECTSLQRAGYAVTLVVAAELDPQRKTPVKLVALPRPMGRRARMTTTAAAVFRTALKLRGDLYHFHDPELIPVGLLLKLAGKRVVYDVHEELPQDLLDKEWLPRPLRYVLAGAAYVVEGLAGLVFDGIVASRPALLERFPRRKTALVNNFPVLGELQQPGARPLRERPPICAYVGGMSRERGLIELVTALGAMDEAVPLELHIAGPIDPPELLEEARRLPGWKRVRYLGWQSRPQVADLLNRARFGVVTFLPIANHLRSYPTKLFEYMSAGLPTLASDLPLWRELIDAAGVGRLADPSDAPAFARALEWMVTHPDECETMGRQGATLVRQRYNWEAEAESLLGLYGRILNRS